MDMFASNQRTAKQYNVYPTKMDIESYDQRLAIKQEKIFLNSIKFSVIDKGMIKFFKCMYVAHIYRYLDSFNIINPEMNI